MEIKSNAMKVKSSRNKASARCTFSVLFSIKVDTRRKNVKCNLLLQFAT